MLSPYEYDFLFCLSQKVLLAQLQNGVFGKQMGGITSPTFQLKE